MFFFFFSELLRVGKGALSHTLKGLQSEFYHQSLARPSDLNFSAFTKIKGGPGKSKPTREQTSIMQLKAPRLDSLLHTLFCDGARPTGFSPRRRSSPPPYGAPGKCPKARVHEDTVPWWPLDWKKLVEMREPASMPAIPDTLKTFPG